jgi:hypothetical protein
MLDGLHSGTKRCHDSGEPVTVGRNEAISSASFLDDRDELFVGELLMNRIVDF